MFSFHAIRPSKLFLRSAPRQLQQLCPNPATSPSGLHLATVVLFFFLRWGTAQSTARLYHYLDSLVHSIPLCSLTPPRGNHPGEKQTIVLEAWSEMPPRDGPSLPLLLSPHKSEKWTTTPPPSLGLLAVAACVSVTRKKSILPSPSRETQSPTVLAVDEPCTLSNC